MTNTQFKEKALKRIEAYRRRRAYKITPLTDTRYKPRIGEEYCERHRSSPTDKKAICFECRKIWNDSWVRINDKKRTCTCGSTNIIRIGPIARLPRKNASKGKWDEFWNHCGTSCSR